MLSLIICSRTPALDEALLQNIAETTGVPYEVICVDNSQNRYSIFSAYNYGASLAKYDLLCFMHSDILFRSTDWGKIVAGKLAEPGVGVIGVAGSTLKWGVPTPWWIADSANFERYLRYNIVQHFSAGVVRRTATGKDVTEKWNEVIVLDGVWMCCRKQVWGQLRFDEKNYRGFHFYDLDFSLNAFTKGYRNFVSQEVLLEHFSAGDRNRAWIEVARIFHRKWRRVLPLSLETLGPDEKEELNAATAKDFVRTMTFNRYHDLWLWPKYWFRIFRRAPFAKDTFMNLYLFGRSYVR
jgi:hypothetical protein